MKKQVLALAFGLVTLFTVNVAYASDAKVTKIPNGTIKVDGNKTSVFNQGGKWLYSIERFTADALPKDVLDAVKKDFDQYYISGMEKVEQPGLAPVYFAHLVGNESIKVVKVNMSDGEVQLVKDFVKG